MTGGRRGALAAAALLALATLAPGRAPACELLLSEHRSGHLLERLPLPADGPAFDIAFTHSVLGTPVLDRYVWRGDALGGHAELVEELFEGEGYGLPAQAAEGETFERVRTADGPRWRLRLKRVVHPLVVRPLPAQSMRVKVRGQPPVLLGRLTTQAVLVQAQGCGPS